MSRIATKPIVVPPGVTVEVKETEIHVKGAKSQLVCVVPSVVAIQKDGALLKVSTREPDGNADAIAGTMRVMISNMILGVSKGFEKKLKLVGVGYRANVVGDGLSLTLGFSHPVTYKAPRDIHFETPTQTDITVLGADKQLVGQVAAEIRHFRSPEPYKGKGIRYAEENVHLKETKKK